MQTPDRRDLLKGLGLLLASSAAGMADLYAQPASKPAFELRIYHCNEGKLDDLLARFRNHTVALFKRHGIESVGYWVPTDDTPLKGRTLFYLLKYPSREEASTRWKTFQTDPEWVQVRTASETNGKLVEHVDSTFLELTDFSPRV
jgi:hypothetical protein